MAEMIDVQNVRKLFEGIARERAALLKREPPDPDGWFKTIDGPPGKGLFHTGHDGWDALQDLTASAMAQAGIAGRADHGAVQIILGRMLLEKFAFDGLEIDQRNVARVMSKAVKEAKQAFVSLTHFIPCQLSSDPEPVGLSLGPVRFLSRREAKTALRAALRAERAVDEKFGGRDRGRLLRALLHHKGYRWFVQVPVANCAPERSAEIAQLAASSALDFLQAILGARDTQRMAIDARPYLYEQIAEIRRDDTSGRYSVTTGWAALGAGLPAGWTALILDEEEEAIALEQAGVVLESRLDPDLVRPLSQRLLDVAQWFGEAVRDRSSSTRLVKYVTALERLTLTRKERSEGVADRIADIVSDRVAALVTDVLEGRDFAQNKSAFKRVYSVRSELVHGSISPLDPKVASAVRDANDYCELSINRALHLWDKSALVDPGFTSASLEEWFDRFVAYKKDVRATDL